MERKVEAKYSSLEYSTILSIIENICIGLESIKEYSYIDKSILIAIDKHLDIIKKYYNDLSKKSNLKEKYISLSKEEMTKIELIFEIEYNYKPITVEIWRRELSNVENFDKDGPYNLLVHMFRNDDTIEYKKDILNNDKIGCISTSIISSDDEHKHFENDNANYGLVYGINADNFLGACECDAQLEQTTDDLSYANRQCFSTVKKGDKHSINSTIYTYKKNYQMTLTKTPNCLKKPYYIESNVPFYTEIGLDKAFSKPLAVIHYYGCEEIDEKINQKVEYFAKLYDIDIIKIHCENKKVI